MTDGVNRGIASTNGDVWKEHRHFSASVLRNFGLGGNTLAGIIQEEVNHFMALLESLNGEPKNVQLLTSISVSNIICSIIVGQRYEYGNKEFRRLQEIMDFNFDKIRGTAILNYFPWLRFLPGDLFSYKLMKKRVLEVYDIFARVHVKENENVVGEPGNFVAAYFQEIKVKRLAGEKTYLEKANLFRLILDLFGGGTEPTTTTIGWVFLYMVNYPDIQERIFQEITDQIGVDRTPIMQDKSKLVFLEATIMEVQRIVALLPFSFPRVVSREVNLQEYVIPKDAIIIANFESILCDPLLWGEDAGIFRPDRFIDIDGNLTSPEAWVPFSLGRRSCLGESMARMELFLFISNILQKFQILPADPEALPSFKGKLGLTHRPLPFEVRMVCRTSR